ncbi:MAG: hypothetical protein QM483_09030 [Desulfuromusa sp.]
MRQQINLYQDVLLDKPEPFQSRQVGMLLILIVTGLALVGFYSYWQANSLQVQADDLRQRQQLLSDHVVQLEEQYPERAPSILLLEKIKRIELELRGRRTALDYFTKQDQDRNGTMLVSLEGLARYPQQGIWLRRISLLHAGEEVQLAGSALKPEQIPEYLHLLGEKNIFGGQVFARLKLKRLKEHAGQIEFELDSAGAKK